MPVSSSDIEKILRKAIAAKATDTPDARQAVYAAAENALLKHLQTRQGADPSKEQNLRQAMKEAIISLETSYTDVVAVNAAIRDSEERIRDPMTDTISTVEPAPTKSRAALYAAIVVVLAGAAAGGWYVMYGRNSNVPVQGRALEVSKDTLATAISKLTLDAQVVGFADNISFDGSQLKLSGWAGDMTTSSTPVSILAYAGEDPLGAAGARGKRPDVKHFIGEPEIAFSIAATGACPKGTQMTVLAVTNDGRYSPLRFWQSDGLCP